MGISVRLYAWVHFLNVRWGRSRFCICNGRVWWSGYGWKLSGCGRGSSSRFFLSFSSNSFFYIQSFPIRPWLCFVLLSLLPLTFTVRGDTVSLMDTGTIWGFTGSGDFTLIWSFLAPFFITRGPALLSDLELYIIDHYGFQHILFGVVSNVTFEICLYHCLWAVERQLSYNPYPVILLLATMSYLSPGVYLLLSP